MAVVKELTFLNFRFDMLVRRTPFNQHILATLRQTTHFVETSLYYYARRASWLLQVLQTFLVTSTTKRISLRAWGARVFIIFGGQKLEKQS